MATFTWGVATNSNGYNGWWSAPGVRTNGIPMPTARLSRNGNRPIYIGAIWWAYASGPASIWDGINYAGVDTGGDSLFGNSGGTFSYWIRGSSGTLRFGRDEGAGRTVQSENTSYSWNGTLAGSFSWAEVPTGPTFSVSRNGNVFQLSNVNVSDNGDSTVTAHFREVQVNGGAWGGATSNWGAPYTGVPGSRYRFRMFARNGVGDSVYVTSAEFTVPYSGGRRATGSSTTTPLTISRRFNGNSWVDLSTRKRYNGNSWVNITN